MHTPTLQSTVRPVAGTIWYSWKGSFAETLLLLSCNGLCCSAHITGTVSVSLPCTFSLFESHCSLSDHYRPMLQCTLSLSFSLHNWKRQLLIETHLIVTVSDKEAEIARLTLTFPPRVRRTPWIASCRGESQQCLQRLSRMTWDWSGALSQLPAATHSKRLGETEARCHKPYEQTAAGAPLALSVLGPLPQPPSPPLVRAKNTSTSLFGAAICEGCLLDQSLGCSWQDTSLFSLFMYLYTGIFVRWMEFVNANY